MLGCHHMPSLAPERKTIRKTILPICSMYGIFTYIWVIFRANVGKYSIHGSYGLTLPFSCALNMPTSECRVIRLYWLKPALDLLETSRGPYWDTNHAGASPFEFQRNIGWIKTYTPAHHILGLFKTSINPSDLGVKQRARMTQTSQNPSLATPENMARVALATPAPRPSEAGLLQGSGVVNKTAGIHTCLHPK